MSASRPLRAARVGERLAVPAALRPAAPLAGRTSRDALVLVILTGEAALVRNAAAAIVAVAADIEQWYARVAILVEDVAATGDVAADRRLVADPGAELRGRLGVAPDRSALIIADRYDQLYQYVQADSPAALPGPDEIEQWTRFLATQCPECGVIDEPGFGEWDT